MSNENNFERLQLKHNISVKNVTVVNWHRTLNQEYMEFFLEQVFLGNQLQWKRCNSYCNFFLNYVPLFCTEHYTIHLVHPLIFFHFHAFFFKCKTPCRTGVYHSSIRGLHRGVTWVHFFKVKGEMGWEWPLGWNVYVVRR